MTVTSADPIWEQKYAAGHRQRYPWDVVVSFIFRHAPKNRERSSVTILEVGCGTASNIWFAAREGFQVAGIDSSASAIATARAWFAEDGLAGDLRVSDFCSLPFGGASFDLAIDRSAISCVGRSSARQAMQEIHRVLKPGGHFLFTPYADSHSSAASGRPGRDGLTTDITGGTVAGAGAICFYSRRDVIDVLADAWTIESMRKVEIAELLNGPSDVHAEWRVIAAKGA